MSERVNERASETQTGRDHSPLEFVAAVRLAPTADVVTVSKRRDVIVASILALPSNVSATTVAVHSDLSSEIVIVGCARGQNISNIPGIA